MTGLTAVSSELMGKRLDLLREMNPLATTVAYLIDPRAQDSEEPTRAMVGMGELLPSRHRHQSVSPIFYSSTLGA